MYKTTVKRYIHNIFEGADIQLNGNRSWDLQVHDERFYPRLLWNGSLGLGEAYMDGWVSSPRLDESISRILQADLTRQSRFPAVRFLTQKIGTYVLNRQSKRRALQVGRKHYDLSNHLFECMLDKRMAYSCGYWKEAKNLDEAQEAKLELVCRKLNLKPGMKVLDIGCGWGSFAKYAAEKYQAYVVGITISQAQLELAKQRCRGYPIELRFQDYRDVNERFDRVVSIGQMEHVGYKNYRAYMQMVARCLPDDGIFLLHTIGSNYSVYGTDPWIDKYIFPNGMLPSIAQLSKASEELFVTEDLHNFGSDYDKTLMAWNDNFNKHWEELKSDYDERFHRMWSYYLLTCAGAFRARQLQLWQFVYSKKGIPGGHTSVR